MAAPVRFLTGITTTGTPHLGNYVGAIRPFVPGGPTGAGWTLYPPQAILDGTAGSEGATSADTEMSTAGSGPRMDLCDLPENSNCQDTVINGNVAIANEVRYNNQVNQGFDGFDDFWSRIIRMAWSARSFER